MSDPSVQFLQDLFSWTSIAIWLSAVIAWFVFKALVRRAGRTKPGKVAIGLIPVLALILMLTGLWEYALFLFLLFVLVLVVLWRSRSRKREEESDFAEMM